MKHWSKVRYKLYRSYESYERAAAVAIDVWQRRRNRRRTAGNCARCGYLHSGSCDIPAAPVYVLSNDRFFSHSPYSRGINVCVVPCASIREAREVESWIRRNRDDQKYIRIAMNKPRQRGRRLSLLQEWRYDALGIEEPR